MEIVYTPVPEFSICLNNYELPEQEIILHTKKPFWMCQVFKFSTQSKMTNYLKKHKHEENSRIMAFYNIAFVPIGALSATRNKSMPNEILKQMANFYAIEKSGDEEFESHSNINKKP